MKKKITIDKLSVKSFVTEMPNESNLKGKGRFSVNETPCSAEPEFCNWTYNAWCYSGVNCNTNFCTVPK